MGSSCEASDSNLAFRLPDLRQFVCVTSTPSEPKPPLPAGYCVTAMKTKPVSSTNTCCCCQPDDRPMPSRRIARSTVQEWSAPCLKTATSTLEGPTRAWLYGKMTPTRPQMQSNCCFAQQLPDKPTHSYQKRLAQCQTHMKQPAAKAYSGACVCISESSKFLARRHVPQAHALTHTRQPRLSCHTHYPHFTRRKLHPKSNRASDGCHDPA